MMIKTAAISDCGLYRYQLRRVWDQGGEVITFCMLNPSTANADADDHTVRKCIGFARRHGFGGIRIVNLFAFRSRHPRDLKTAGDPVGPLNAAWLRGVEEPVIVAWGNGVRSVPGGDEMARILRIAARRRGQRFWRCFGKTKWGEPRHPLTLSYNTKLEGWR